jgi:hypothetical protein
LMVLPVLLLVVLLQLLLECNIAGRRLFSLVVQISGLPRPSLRSSRAFGLEIDMYHVYRIATSPMCVST